MLSKKSVRIAVVPSFQVNVSQFSIIICLFLYNLPTDEKWGSTKDREKLLTLNRHVARTEFLGASKILGGKSFEIILPPQVSKDN